MKKTAVIFIILMALLSSCSVYKYNTTILLIPQSEEVKDSVSTPPTEQAQTEPISVYSPTTYRRISPERLQILEEAAEEARRQTLKATREQRERLYR